ncbi:hypothetical protein [Runella sp.]|uniref:hypothetical protein n=1 Tax=Runella sp. TaxID=1960881 RepID=UPI003D146D53
MKKFTFFFSATLLICGAGAVAQSSVTIDPKVATTSLIDAVSTTKGILPPRMNISQRNALTLSTGLQVYCTDCTPAGPYSYNGSTWIAMFQTTTVSPITYTVGQTAQGGIVFWIDPASGGQHGLVAATADQSAATKWLSTDYVTANAFRVGAYGGKYNTDRIIDSQGNGTYAALLAAQYTDSDGYGDWYLPSKNELNLMYAQKNAIGGFTGSNYWSSTEVSVSEGLASENVYVQDFGTGTSGNALKSVATYRVRAIRRF